MRQRLVRFRGILGFCITFAASLAQSVGAQGLTARIAPEASAVRWSEGVGLENAGFFGGSASLGFGRYVLLRTSYKVAASVSTELAASGYVGGAGVENGLDASLFSTEVQLRLGGGRIAPVILGGGGVLGLSPDGRDDVRQVMATYGGGIDARLLPWLDAQLLVQDVRLRLDRSSIAAAGGGAPPADVDRGDLRSSLAFSASLGARLGGGRRSAAAERLDTDVGTALSGGEGLMIPVEVTGGVVRFADALSIGDQALGGLRTGFDFGPYFGLRGSYARGFTSSALVGMSAWSAEAQFNVGRVTGLAPHLLLGYGGLSFWGDFLDENGARPKDEGALILGAGIGLPITDRSRFVVTIRDFVTSAGSASSVSSPSDLRHNFGLSAGLSYVVRGGRPALGGPSAPRPGLAPPLVGAQDDAPVPADVQPVEDVVEAVADSGAAPAPVAQPVEDVVAGSVPSGGIGVVPEDAAPSPAGPEAAGYQSDRVITIAVPTQGELYIRYGPPTAAPGVVALSGARDGAPPTSSVPQTDVAAVSPQASDLTIDSTVVARLIRAELAQQDPVTRTDLEQLEGRIVERVTAALQALEEARASDAAVARASDATEPTDSATGVTRADLATMEDRISERLLSALDRVDNPPDSAALTSLVRSEIQRMDTVPALTRDDLAAVEERLSARLAEMAAAEPTDSSTLAADGDAELSALAAQVDELTRLVRGREQVNDASAPTTIAVAPAGEVVEVAGRARDPILRGFDVLIGTSSVRGGGAGFGGKADVMVSELFEGRLRPYVGVQAGRAGVDGVLTGAPFSGHVTSFGGAVGVSARLPGLGSVTPEVNLGLLGIGGRVTGDTPLDSDAMKTVYGGFVMGPRLALDAIWRRDPSARWLVASSVARTWAGARGGWSFQVGVRWERPFTRSPSTFRQQVSQEPLVSRAEPIGGALPSAAPPELPVTTPEDLAPVRDSVAEQRIASLEQALAAEREARQRSENAADSVARAERRAVARADSLRSLNDDAARAQRERTAADSSRTRFRAELESLLGVVESVEAIRQTERGLEVVIGGGVFPTGGVSLDGGARGGIRRVASILTRADGHSFLIDGHTDSTGSEETNRVISQRRAEAIRAVLIEEGIAPARIGILASGEAMPIAGNDTPAGRAQNRRVEIVIVAF